MSRPSTIRGSIAGIVATARPELAFSFPRTFIVRTCDPATGACDIYPPPESTDLPPEGIAGVEQWTMGGALYFPAAGARCVVVFRDAKETQPAIVGFEPAAPGPAAARATDFVQRLAFFPGVPTVSPALIWGSATPDPGPYTWTPLFVVGPTGPLPTDPGTVATIVTGSSKVKVAT